MTSKNFDPNDGGIKLFLCQDPANPPAAVAAAADKEGNVLVATALDNVTSFPSSRFSRAGYGDFVSCRVAGHIAAGGSFDIGFQAGYSDAANPTLWSPADIQSVRTDTGDAQAKHTIKDTDLVQAAVDAVAFPRKDVVLQTTDLQATHWVRAWIKWGQAVQAGDWVLLNFYSFLRRS